MHALTFQMKRAHLCAVALGRRLFDGRWGEASEKELEAIPDMTPARFDILFLIHKYTGPKFGGDYGMGHARLRRLLGLHPSTICKAIKRLVGLGLVRSGKSDGQGDERTRSVWLTDEGRRRIRRALHLVFTKRALSRHIRRFAKKYIRHAARRSTRSVYIDEELDAMWSRAIELSSHFGNTADLVYHLRYDPDPC